MRFQCRLLVCVLLVTGSASVASAQRFNDFFRGEWEVVSVTDAEGKPQPSAVLKGIRLVEDQVILRTVDQEPTGLKCRIDESVTPKQIDIWIDKGEGPIEPPLRGIFEVAEEKAVVCLNASGGVRPKELAADQQKHFKLIELKRPTAKPE